MNNYDSSTCTNIIYTGTEQMPTSNAYKRMSCGWQKTWDTLQSAEYFRQLGPVYIPRFPKETEPQYQQRLKRTFHQSYIRDITSNLCSRPLTRPISVTDVPEPLEPIEYDADLLGSNISQYFKQVFQHGLRFGMAFTLVDFSNVVPENLAIQQELQLRPSFTFIAAYDMINYKTDLQANGTSVLTEIVYRSSEDIDGSIKEILNTVRADGTWNKKIKDEDGQYYVYDEGTHTYRGIPLSVLYLDRENFMESRIPFESIVDKNIEYTQVASDYNNLITHIQIPILFGQNFTEEEMSITISPSSFVHSVNADSGLQYVEMNGAGAAVGKQRLDDIEQEIYRLGGLPVTQKTQDITATSAFIKHSNANSDLMAWAIALQNHVEECYEIAANWMNIDLGEFSAEVYKDWILTGQNNDVNTLMSLNTQGLLSDDTTLSEIQRRGLFSNSFNVDEELEKIAEEPNNDA